MFLGKFNFVWWSFLFFFLKHLCQWSKVKQWKIFVIQDVKRLSGKQFLRTAWFSKNFSFQAILLVQIEWQPFFIFHLKSSVKLLRKTVRKCAVRHCVLKKSNWEIPKRHTAEKNIKKWKLAKLLESHKKNISRKKIFIFGLRFSEKKSRFPARWRTKIFQSEDDHSSFKFSSDYNAFRDQPQTVLLLKGK